MGKCHAMAYNNAELLFPDWGLAPQMVLLIDEDTGHLDAMQRLFPRSRISTDWTEAISDPEVDLIDVCLPDKLHFPIAKAALEAGKHVYCEKPLTENAAQARELARLAAAGSLVTRVGHNFPRNPVHDLAREIVDAGEIDSALDTYENAVNTGPLSSVR